MIDTKTGIKGGNITDYKKTPYGNSILVQNTETGEKLRYSHLSVVAVGKGDVLDTGSFIGKSGATGNTTGAHLDLEYYDKNGKLADVMRSAYGKHYVGDQYTDELKKQVYGQIGKGVDKVKTKAAELGAEALYKTFPFLRPAEEVDLNDYILNYL